MPAEKRPIQPTIARTRLALLALVLCSVAAPAAAAPGDLCDADADCGHAYLACVQTQVFACEADAAAALLDGGSCAPTIPETRGLCTPTYQRECKTDKDCGPAGFTCDFDNGMLCGPDGCRKPGQCTDSYRLCETDCECPEGWSCYAPTGGPISSSSDDDGGSDASATERVPKACYPPFARFHGGHGPGVGNPDCDGGNARDASAARDAGSSSMSVARRRQASDGGCAIVAAGSDATAFPGWLLACIAGIVALRRRGIVRGRGGDHDPGTARDDLFVGRGRVA